MSSHVPETMDPEGRGMLVKFLGRQCPWRPGCENVFCGEFCATDPRRGIGVTRLSHVFETMVQARPWTGACIATIPPGSFLVEKEDGAMADRVTLGPLLTLAEVAWVAVRHGVRASLDRALAWAIWHQERDVVACLSGRCMAADCRALQLAMLNDDVDAVLRLWGVMRRATYAVSMSSGVRTTALTATLVAAAQRGRVAVVAALLDEPDLVDVHALDDAALRVATQFRQTDVVACLLAAGASVHACDYEARRTALALRDAATLELLLRADPPPAPEHGVLLPAAAAATVAAAPQK